MQRKPIILVDIEGPLLDYNAAYGPHWERFFGESAHLVNPDAFWPFDQWDVRRLKGEELKKFNQSFDERFWMNLPPVKNAVNDIAVLSERFTVIGLTCSEPDYNEARRKHLNGLGFKLATIISVGRPVNPKINVKAAVINDIRPVAVVDDQPIGLKGLSPEIIKVLFARAMKDPRHPKNLPGAFDDRYRVVNRLASVGGFIK